MKRIKHLLPVLLIVLISQFTMAQVPVANFTSNITNVCPPGGCVNFTDLSTNTPTSWYWIFPGGTPATSTLQNPTVCYNNSGTYNVTLGATNGFGADTLTQVSYITVGLFPNINSVNESCVPGCDGSATSNPTGGTPPYTYLWDPLAGNQTTPTATGLCAGTYSVTVTDFNSCTGTNNAWIGTNAPMNIIMSSVDANCVICDGAGIANVTGGLPPYTYQWDGNAGNQTTQTATGLCAGFYLITITDANTCAQFDTAFVSNVMVSVNLTYNNMSCAGPCDGDASSAPSNGTPPYIYSWSTGATGSSINGLCAGNYSVTVQDNNGCTGTSSFNIIDPVTISACDSVWPGDCNYDLVANNFDMLPIGIAFGTSDSIRFGATTNWVPQFGWDWADTLNNGTDYKHIDTDGNGIINNDDTLAISLNYGNTHLKQSPPNIAGPADPDLFFDFPFDTIPANTQIDIPLHLGTNLVPADNVYGLAFTVNFDPNLIDSVYIQMNFDNSWLGTVGNDLIFIDKDFYNNGKLEVGVTRTDHVDANGFGQIASLGIVTTDDLIGKMPAAEAFVLSISNVLMISNDETVNPVNPIADSTILLAITDRTVIHEASVMIYPNPAKDLLNVVIAPDLKVEKLTLTNVLGEMVKTITLPGSNTLQISTSQFPDGVYFLEVKTDRGALVKRLSLIN